MAPTIDKDIFMHHVEEEEADRAWCSSSTAFLRLCFQADGTSGADDAGCGKTIFLQVTMKDDSNIRCDVFRQYRDDGQNTLADGTSVVAQMHEWEMISFDFRVGGFSP